MATLAFSSVIIATSDPVRLKIFYHEILGIPSFSPCCPESQGQCTRVIKYSSAISI